MAQRLWSEAEVANAALAASSQNLQPAGTGPACAFTPTGTEPAKQIATGDCRRSSDAARLAANSEHLLCCDISASHRKTQIADECDDSLLGCLLRIESDCHLALGIGRFARSDALLLTEHGVEARGAGDATEPLHKIGHRPARSC